MVSTANMAQGKLNHFIKEIDEKHHVFFLVTVTFLLLALATAISGLFFLAVPNTYTYNITLIYILALVLIAHITANYYTGFAASIISIICINYFYTYPYFKLHFTLAGYPITFMGMITISLLTSTAATHMRQQAHIIEERDKFFLEAEKEKTKANLMRAISHDIRTPLTSIMGSSTSYLENKDILSEEEKDKLLYNIREDSQWLINMVENILSVTRINDAGTATLHTSTELVEEVLEEAATRFKKRMPGVPICMKVPDNPILVPMDAVLIEQVIINLLENAAYHGQGTLPIECYVEEQKQQVIFYVRDYGIGISQEKLETLFEVTSSPHSTVDSHKGMGIGLSICKSIIRAHGGHIQGKNCDIGCEFSFSLPKGGFHES